jgi:lambda family phage minor tail protein L
MSNNDIITTDLQSLEVDSGLVELFELELSAETTLYFHPGVDENLSSIEFDGNTYVPLPLELTGIETTSDGASNRPAVTIANVTNIFKSALEGENFSFEDLIGKRITRRQTLEKYLLNASFEFPKKIYILDRIAAENALSVTFELAAPFDVSGVRIPSRIVVGKYCSWVYQGMDRTPVKGGCRWRKTSVINYDGTDYSAYFDIDDRPLVQSGSVTPITYSAPHAIDDIVVYSGRYWRSEAADNSVVPSSTSIFWKEIFFWSNWSSGPSYSIGQYVRHDDHIWKCLVATSSIEPVPSTVYWKRVDYCGKTLNSCKVRFQFTPTAEGTPAVANDTSKVLPFGAFPGSVKF